MDCLEAYTAIRLYILAFARRITVMLPARLRLGRARGGEVDHEPEYGNSDRTGNRDEYISEN